MATISAAWAYARANGVKIGIEVLVNFAGPFVIFHLAEPGLGDAKALLASSGPPIAWSIIQFARNRRIDAVSMLVLAGIGLSLLAFVGGGGARFLQLREALVGGLIGLVFLGSAAIGRPLIYALARAGTLRRSAAEAQEFEALRDNVYFRRSMMIMTLVWGFGLVAGSAVSSLLVFTMSVSEFLLVGPVVGYGTTGALALWTVWFVRRQRRRGAERRAAAAKLAGEPQAPLA